MYARVLLVGLTLTCADLAAAFRVPGLAFELLISDYVHELLLPGEGPIYANCIPLLVAHLFARLRMSGISFDATVELGLLLVRPRALRPRIRIPSPLEVVLTPGTMMAMNVNVTMIMVVVVVIAMVNGPIYWVRRPVIGVDRLNVEARVHTPRGQLGIFLMAARVVWLHKVRRMCRTLCVNLNVEQQ